MHQQRQARGVRPLHDRPPARARSALQPRPLQHWPQFPAPIPRTPPRRSVPPKSPRRPSAPHAGKRRGARSPSSRDSRASRRASPARHGGGSLRSPRFSRARRSSSRGPQPPVPGAERLGRASQPGPRLGGRAAIELRSCTNTTGLSCTRSCGRAVRAGRRRATAAHAPAPAAPQAAEVGRRRPSACRAAAAACTAARDPPRWPHRLQASAARRATALTQLPLGLRPQQCPFLPPRAAALGRLRRAQSSARTPGF